MERVLSLLGLLLVFVLIGCEEENNSFIVGMECDYAPYNWTVTESDASDIAVQIDGSNQYCEGYDVQVASRLAEDLGLDLMIRKIAWDGLPSALNSNQIDAIIAGMSPTPERAQTMNFTNAYFTEDSEQVVVLRSDSDYLNANSLNDFTGATVIAQLGTFQVDLIAQLDGANSGTHLADYPAVINSVVSGVADAYIAERAVAEAHVANNSELTFISFIDGFELDPAYNTVAVALRLEDTELRADINEALAKISEDTRVEWMDEASLRAGE
ncbi:transporter substrate-binding domain-containing protein [Mycoplasmatota bacterium]|nr:transporter substrate-binding domain-containing protein [Mycoplasmatota bacterium]